MTDYSRAEAARRAGEPLDEVDRLVELGAIRPAEGDRFSAGDVRRIGLVRAVVESGIPMSALADAVRTRGLNMDFLDLPAYERFAGLTDQTFQAVSERTGVPLSLLMVVREACGLAQPSPDDRMREDELEIVPFLEMQKEYGFRPTASERLLRVQGDSLRRIAEQEAEWWRTEVVQPRLEAGVPFNEVGNVEWSDRMAAQMQDALLAIYHAHENHAWMKTILEGFEQALDSVGLYSRLERVPAMCFLDITGYTRLTAEQGDAAAAELAASVSRLVERSSVSHAGRPVKWLGDGVMFYFRDPGPGVEAALEMVDGVAAAGLPPAHVGLHAGPVIFQEGDYYGQTVNLASRIAEYARPGEVLVSKAVVEAAGSSGVSFRDIGPVELKGVGSAVHLLSAHRG